MPEEKKKSGLHKDLSSIFSGLEEIDNGRGEKNDPPQPAEEPIEQPAEEPAGEDKTGEAEAPAVLVAPSTPAVSKDVTEKLNLDGSFPRRRNAINGLDIGQSSIKLVQLYPVGDGWEIGGYALQEIRLEQDEEGLDKPDFLLKHLKELIAETGARGQQFVCSLRGDSVNTSLIPLARMPKKEMESACRLEAKRRVAFNVDKAFLQSYSVREKTERPGGKLNHIVTVVRREMVNRRLGILQEAGLQVVALLPLPFAWKAFLNRLVGADASRTAAIVDIGSDRTQVSIFKGEELQFNREFETGGDQVTEAIIQAGLSLGGKVDISWEEAEELKKTKNLLQAGLAAEPVKGNLNTSHVISMVRPVLERIAKESQRSLEYYRQLFRGEGVNRIYLSGGGALVPGLARFFQDRVRTPVELLRLPQNVTLHPSLKSREEVNKLFPRLSKAAALAATRKPEINFIPLLDKIVQNILQRKILVILPAVFLFGCSFLFYQSKAKLIPTWKKSVGEKRAQYDRIGRELAPYEVLSELREQLKNREKIGQLAFIRQPNWRGVLKELSRITPSDIILTQIYLVEGVAPQSIFCEGCVVRTKDQASLRSVVTEFIVKVETSPFFKEVEMVSENLEKGSLKFGCTLVY